LIIRDRYKHSSKRHYEIFLPGELVKPICVSILIILLLPVSDINAEKLDVLPTLVLTAGYDDNILFTRKESIADYYIKAVPGLDLKVASQRYDVGLSAYAALFRYIEEQDLDTDNYNFDFDGGYSLSARMSIRAKFRYLKDTTLDSELEETGRVNIRENRERLQASGQLSYQVDEVSRLGLNYDYRKTNYESDVRVNRDVHSIDLSYQRWLVENIDLLSISPSYDKAVTATGTEYDYYRLSGGWTHIFSKTLRMKNILGYGYTVTTEENESSTNQVWNADLSVTKSAETTSLKLGFRSDIRLDSIGELLEVDRIYINLRQSITERFSFRFYGSGYITRPVEKFDSVDKTYYVLRPGVAYNMTENHVLTLSYRYQNEYNHNTSEDPGNDRYVIELNLNFKFPVQK